jgi:hypothetical protein
MLNDQELVVNLRKPRLPSPVLNEYERDRIYRKYFYKKLKENPKTLLKRKFHYLASLYFDLNENWRVDSFKSFLVMIPNFLLLLLAALSLWKYRGEWSVLFGPFWWILVYFHMIAFIPRANWRFNMPNIPLLILLATPALVRYIPVLFPRTFKANN